MMYTCWTVHTLKKYFTCLYKVIYAGFLHSFYHLKCAVVIYNAKIVLVIIGRDVSSADSHGPPCTLCNIVLSLAMLPGNQDV